MNTKINPVIFCISFFADVVHGVFWVFYSEVQLSQCAIYSKFRQLLYRDLTVASTVSSKDILPKINTLQCCAFHQYCITLKWMYSSWEYMKFHANLAYVMQLAAVAELHARAK